MKAHNNYPRCQRCGYQYDPKTHKKMFIFNRRGEETYIACSDCITAYGRLLKGKHTKADEEAFLETFKVPEPPAPEGWRKP